MALTNQWVGTTDDPTVATNWLPHDVTTVAYRWVTCAGGTNEFRLQLAGGGDPGIQVQPASVYINGVLASQGTAGSLAAGEWDYDDLDSDGFDTIYVRLAAGTDPDLNVAGYIKFYQVPQAGEAVIIPDGSGDMESNVDLSATTLGVVTVAKSNDNRAHGSQFNPIRIKCTGFIFEGGGQTPAYFDLMDSAIAPEIRSTASVEADEFGLHLAGSAVTLLDVKGGSVGLAMLPSMPFTCTTGVRSRGNSARVGIGSTAVAPLLECLLGIVEHENSIANIDVHGGLVRTKNASAASGVVTVNGGSWSEESSGTKASVIQNGGNIDVTQDGSPVTWTLYKHNAGTLRDDTDRLTIGTQSRADFPGVATRSRI